MIQVREFNDQGIEYFKELLQEAKNGKLMDLPEELTSSKKYTKLFEPDIFVEKDKFTSRREITMYLSKKFSGIEKSRIHYNVNLWSWLSALYFESVCPKKKDGTRKVNALNRHVLDTDHWGRYYRHLLASSYRLYDELNDLSKIYLSGKIHEFGEHFEQLAAQQKFVTSQGVVEAATILYWDEKNETIKKNARDKEGAGVIRRLTINVLNQFDITYDLNSMSGEDIIKLLPKEFDQWKNT